MRILFATTGLFPDVIGGMERHSYFLVRGLARLGAQVDLVHPIEGRTYFPDMPNVRNVVLPWRRMRFPYHYIGECIAYSRAVARFIEKSTDLPDVAFGQGYTLVAYVRRRKVPCVFHPHGLEAFQARPGRESLSLLPFRLMTCYAASHSDRVISLGGKLTEILRTHVSVPETRISEIPNAVDLEFIDAKRGSAARIPKSFLFVGRMAANKGIDLLLAAFSALKDREATLFVVGSGSLLDKFRQQNTDDRIRFLGRVSDEDLIGWYRRVEAFVFCSHYEGMPTVILEAMASRLPVIATDIGAVRALVSPDTGILISPGDAAQLTDAIAKILALSETQRKQLGDNARMHIERSFTWDAVAEATYSMLHAEAARFTSVAAAGSR